MGHLSGQESDFQKWELLKYGCMHSFIMRPILTTVSLIFF